MTQPWASLLAIGTKVYETRSWATQITGPIAIHACAGFPGWAKALAEEPEYFDALRARRLYSWNLPLGAVVAVADLVRCCDIPYDNVVSSSAGSFPVCSLERRLGNFQRGRFAWQLANPRLLKEPIPATGRQGFWDWAAPENLEELLTLKTPAELTA